MKIKKSNFLNLVVYIIAVFAVFLSIIFYYKLNSINKINSDKNLEVQDLIEKVSDLYLVPEGEEPTVATVSDPDVLKNQSFFTLSQKGDKVLIFKNAGRAILYRPSINKIIEIAPVKSNKDLIVDKKNENDKDSNQ